MNNLLEKSLIGFFFLGLFSAESFAKQVTFEIVNETKKTMMVEYSIYKLQPNSLWVTIEAGDSFVKNYEISDTEYNHVDADGFCIANDGFNTQVYSVGSVDSINKILKKQHGWMSVDLLGDKFGVTIKHWENDDDEAILDAFAEK